MWCNSHTGSSNFTACLPAWCLFSIWMPDDFNPLSVITDFQDTTASDQIGSLLNPRHKFTCWYTHLLDLIHILKDITISTKRQIFRNVFVYTVKMLGSNKLRQTIKVSVKVSLPSCSKYPAITFKSSSPLIPLSLNKYAQCKTWFHDLPPFSLKPAWDLPMIFGHITRKIEEKQDFINCSSLCLSPLWHFFWTQSNIWLKPGTTSLTFYETAGFLAI